MELKTYLAILWRRKWVIAITAVVTVLVTAVGALILPPTYEASTTLRIAPAGGGSTSYMELMYATQLRNTFAQIATSDMVLDQVAQRLELEEPPEVKAEMLGNSELLRLTVEDPNPRVAQKAANSTADILMDLHKELYISAEATAWEVLSAQLAQVERELSEARTEYEAVITQFPDELGLLQEAAGELELKRQTYGSLLEQHEEARVREALRTDAVSVFEPASLPETPAGLPRVLFVALGFIAGLTAGVGLAFLFENLDSTLYTSEQIEAVTQISMLGKIPTDGKQHSIAFSNGRLPQKDAFRRLRTNLYALDDSSSMQALLVTSAEPQEGRSTVVANLACAMAESGRQVVAVDCDLRRPALHAIFDLPNEIGLSSVLEQQATLDAALHSTEISGLDVLCAGPSTPKLAELLGSCAMTNLIGELRQRFDVVLLDTPAIAAVTDAAMLAPSLDGVLLVVRRAKAREGDVRAACQQLADVGARPIGVVVNRASRDGSSYYYYRHLEQPDTAHAGNS
jgi:non-specific protein-tyrosine kinase